MTVGDRIRAVRKEKGITQAELARRLNTSYVTVSQWENGQRNPKVSTIERIAAALDVYPSDLMGWGAAVDAVVEATVKGEKVPKLLPNITVTVGESDPDADLRFALFGDDDEITPEMVDEVKAFAAFIKQREAEKKRTLGEQ